MSPAGELVDGSARGRFGTLEARTGSGESWAAAVAPEVVVLTNPLSAAAEAVRGLKSQLQGQMLDQGIRSLSILGDAPRCGASFLSANLAVACAQSGLHTVLVDADFGDVRQSRIFNIEPSHPGLADWLRGNVPVQDAPLWVNPIPNLLVVPAGRSPYEPGLLQQVRLTEIIAHLQRISDLVIFDSPPASELADALALAAGAERTIIVSREQRSKLNVLKQLQSLVEQCRGTVAGVVLSRF